jgi:hypothetical protein
MHKALCVAAILLATIVFNSGNSAVHASAPTITSPIIVASGSVVNQTGPIARAEIFTPTQTGLYRLSVYMTLTHMVSVQNTWQFNFSWTDDAGIEQSPVVDMFTNQPPPNAWSYSNVFPQAFEAMAGQPISYQVALGKGTGTNGGVYSLYYTIEQLQ